LKLASAVRRFPRFASNAEYLAGIGHRTAALEDSRILPVEENKTCRTSRRKLADNGSTERRRGWTTMDLNLSGKVALVTGASRGIGEAIAERLAAEGMAIALAARDEGRLCDIASRIEAAGKIVLVHAADLSDPSAPGAFVEVAMQRFGRIDLIVNNAGATKRGDFLTLTEDDWRDGFALKFFGALRLCRTAWPFLSASKGAIVNIAGVGGRTGSAEFTIGGSVNAAMLNLTKCLADRGIRDGVRVNAINPGSIRTDRLAARVAHTAKETALSIDEAERHMTERMGIARFGTPEEIANLVAFLASEQASYVHGAIIDADGGLTRTL
jgi:NAD(P)-dependent dehydrogenase (short-subunit alcohol dehydrogenase family)